MNNRCEDIVIAPDSPPATPSADGAAWLEHHHNLRYFHSSKPQLVVQRAIFTIPKHPSITDPPVLDRNSFQQPESYMSSASPRCPFQPSSIGTPVFKLDEDFPQIPSRGFHQRHRDGKLGVARSESWECLPPDDDEWHGRYGQSEPKNPSTAMQTMDATSQNVSQPVAPRSMEFINTDSKSRTSPRSRSAPIQIPSREEQEAERRRQRAVAEKAKQVAMERENQRNAQYTRSSEQPRREYGLNESSSDESDDGYSMRRR